MPMNFDMPMAPASEESLPPMGEEAGAGESGLASFSDDELVEELKKRGYEVESESSESEAKDSSSSEMEDEMA